MSKKAQVTQIGGKFILADSLSGEELTQLGEVAGEVIANSIERKVYSSKRILGLGRIDIKTYRDRVSGDDGKEDGTTIEIRIDTVEKKGWRKFLPLSKTLRLIRDEELFVKLIPEFKRKLLATVKGIKK